MPTVTATPVLEMQFSGAGGSWTSVAADIRLGVEPTVAEYGIQGVGPMDRMAATGTLTFALDNSNANSGALQGYYSPGHTNVRSGFDLGIGVRLKITYSGTTYYKFRGSLISVQPDAGSKMRQSVRCLAVDWLDEAARTKIRDIATQSSKRADQVINTLITDAVTRQPAATSLNTGQSTFTTVFDNLRDEQTTVYQAIADAALSEFGYFYQKGDTTQGGTVKFEDRHARPKAGAAVATFDNTMYELEAVRTRDDIINRVQVVVHPRKVDAAATTVLYELTPTQTVPSVGAGATIVIQGPFRDATGRFVRIGGDAVVAPAATTDYTGNSASDGSGTNLTSSLTVTAAVSSNSAVFTITNTHATSTIYVTKLQIRGKGVYDQYDSAARASDSASQTSYGETLATIDLPYEDDLDIAQGIADWVLNVYKNPRYTVGAIGLHGNASATLMTQALAREPGDKIALKETVTGLTNLGSGGAEIGYFINGVRLTVGPRDVIDVTWPLAPADQQQAWILGTTGAGEIGVTTVLGYI